MFLKRFKDKSNQKYINNVLNSRISNVKNKRINSVGILFNLAEFSDYDVFKKFIKSLNVKDNKVKFIAYIEDEKDTLNSWDSYYYEKDFGWKGKVNNIELQEFINTKFDLLISYYTVNRYELNIVTALSKANFKVGIAIHDERLNDFIVKVKPNEFVTFITELKKYFKVLNII
ncbi:MAG: hypothetical protein HKO92_01375 [Flavobacteriaceae bacterium]|nr:hypothetical protein [Bacteroidia bacterium]NNK81749.1 hypothetical protein [Flavobacteriaceae bacterium]